MTEEAKAPDTAPPDESEILALLRTPGLSIKNFDAQTKEKIRQYLIMKQV